MAASSTPFLVTNAWPLSGSARVKTFSRRCKPRQAPTGACETISARFDDEAAPVAGPDLDEHLYGCQACRNFEAALADLGSNVRLRSAPPVPQDPVASLVPASRLRLDISGGSFGSVVARLCVLAGPLRPDGRAPRCRQSWLWPPCRSEWVRTPHMAPPDHRRRAPPAYGRIATPAVREVAAYALKPATNEACLTAGSRRDCPGWTNATHEPE